MIRSLISLLISAGILSALLLNYDELDLFMVLFAGFFGVLFLFIAWLSARHHKQLVSARKSTPVAATIFFRTISQRRGPASLTAEITIGDEEWRGTLTGWSHERSFANQTCEGRAWLHPQTGAPLELNVHNTTITPVPAVTKVNRNSSVEKFIRKFYDFDEHKEKPML